MILLFFALLFLIISFPLLERFSFLFPLFSSVLILGILGSSLSQKKTLLLLWSFLLLLISFAMVFFEHIFLTFVFIIGMFFLLWTIASKLIYRIFSSEKVHVEEVLSALSLYLVVGISFALLVFLLDMMNPESYSEVMGWGESLYYSFITMSTLGYGDILPQTYWAMNLAIVQVLFGVFFTATVLALLVGKYSRG